MFNLPPENDSSGNIEYKRLVRSCKTRAVTLSSQMDWRLNEGFNSNGVQEAVYYLGVDDDGSVSGESMESVSDSVSNLKVVANMIDAKIVSRQISVFDKGVVAKIVVRKNELANKGKKEVRICFLGDSNQGKSTLISVLTYGNLDDGKGSARNAVFRYSHEFIDGTTSSVKSELLGYNNIKPVTYKDEFCVSWSDIIKKSDKTVQLIDLPGNPKYVKTTLFGLLSNKPDHVLIVEAVNNSNSVSYSSLCDKLNLSYTKIVTKIDLVDKIDIKDDIKNDTNCITVSSVTGENVDLIYKLLNNVQNTVIVPKTTKSGVEFMINDVCYISDVGIVVSGVTVVGPINLYDKLLIGPYKNSFYDVNIQSIHKKQIPSNILNSGDTGSMILSYDDCNLKINKHMLVLTKNMLSRFCNKFQILFDLDVNFNCDSLETMVFINNIYDKVVMCKHSLKYSLKHSLKQISEHLVYDAKFINNNIHIINNDDIICVRYSDNTVVGKIKLY